MTPDIKTVAERVLMLADILAEREKSGADWRAIAKARNDIRKSAIASAPALAEAVLELETTLRELVDALIPEVNEKGAGGRLLARLSDARAILASTPDKEKA